jgi:methenyltetrahydromethanopterin cyclohydrolase
MVEPENVLAVNERAYRRLTSMLERRSIMRVTAAEPSCGGLLIDAGVEILGGLEAGLELARIATAGLAEVTLTPTEHLSSGCPEVVIRTDHPIAACMACQYAGWRLAVGEYAAMASGPMRAAYSNEDFFNDYSAFRDGEPEQVIGLLESRALPGPDVFEHVAEKTGVRPNQVALLVAPTGSLAGSIQVVARSVETALHKLHALGFDLTRVQGGFGSAPLPPPTTNDLTAIGRTNDAILYGARVTLWVDGDDASIQSVGAQVPSASSSQHGAPFVEVFERYDRDFYKIDPGLFSPAQVTFQNLSTGRSQTFGRLEPAVLEHSFFGES